MNGDQVFRITHPFHPLCGQDYFLLQISSCWGIERVHTVDVDGRRFSFPRSWTSLAKETAFVRVGKGRSFFRMDDLLSLAELITGYGKEEGED